MVYTVLSGFAVISAAQHTHSMVGVPRPSRCVKLAASMLPTAQGYRGKQGLMRRADCSLQMLTYGEA